MLLKPNGNPSKGYLIGFGPDCKNSEHDTVTCYHCQKIIILRVGQIPEGGWCMSCSKMICNLCVDKGICTPWEKQMEKMEARQRMLNSMGL
jgi:hypothetical protein